MSDGILNVLTPDDPGIRHLTLHTTHSHMQCNQSLYIY